MIEFRESEIVYENPLASVGDIEGWRMEGDGRVSFPRGHMRMESLRPPEDGQARQRTGKGKPEGILQI